MQIPSEQNPFSVNYIGTLNSLILSRASEDNKLKPCIKRIVQQTLSQLQQNLASIDLNAPHALEEIVKFKMFAVKKFDCRFSQEFDKFVEKKLVAAELIMEPGVCRLVNSKIKWQFNKSFPSSFAFQIHPENDVMLILNQMPLFMKLNSKLAAIQVLQQEEGPVPVYVPKKDWPEGRSIDKISEYQNTLSMNLVRILTNHFNGKLPPESVPYFKGIKKANDSLLSVPLVTLSEEEFIKLLSQVNALLVPKWGGSIRAMTDIAWDLRRVPKANTEGIGYLDVQLAKYLSAADLAVWKNKTREKIRKALFEKIPTEPQFDDEDRRILDPIAFITPAPEEIQARLQALAKDFLHHAVQSSDPYEIAALCHHGISSLHIFGDGNGRTARFLMNMVLVQAGEKPLIIDNETNYTTAVRSNDPKVFCRYLKELKGKQPVVSKFVEDCFTDLMQINS